MTLITPALQSELTALYSHPPRAYHNTTHVAALLALLERHRAHFADPDAVEAAVWFHDCVYDPRAAGDENEVRSAQVAREKLLSLGGGIDEERVAKICGMIEATATHTIPPSSSSSGGGDEDTALFLDMDMSILAADPEAFDAYEAAVREEYSWVDDAAWRRGRGDVVRGFLARKRLYLSDLFYGLWEGRARGNLGRSLARLQYQ